MDPRNSNGTAEALGQFSGRLTRPWKPALYRPLISLRHEVHAPIGLTKQSKRKNSFTRWRMGSARRFVYWALTQVFAPTSLTDTSEKKTRIGLPSRVPRWFSEIRRGPAFL
jgi:hypothetical protein